MSANDKQKLNELIQNGIAISKKEDNLIEMVTNEGLYAAINVKEEAKGTYQVYRVNYQGTETPIGPAISIPKAFKTGSVKTVEHEGVPYSEAHIGDKYLDMVFSNDDQQEQHFYIPVNQLVDQVEAGNGIQVEGNKVSVKINPGDEANGLEATENGLGLALATANSNGAMSNIDKKAIQSLPTVYDTVKYEIVKNQLPAGCRITSHDDEIRVMFPANADWKEQSSGEGADKDAFYMGVKIFAPNKDVDGFYRGEGKEIQKEKGYITCTSGGDTGGIDMYDRRYYIIWLPVARKDEQEHWTYYGEKSEEGHYIGWYITVEWYEQNPEQHEEAKAIGSETIRVNLSNEKCHNSVLPYYSTQMFMSWEEMNN